MTRRLRQASGLLIAIAAVAALVGVLNLTSERSDTSLTPAPRQWRVFDVDGVEVMAVTNTAELPDVIDRVGYTGLVELGHTGDLIMCGAAQVSSPCQGTVVVGLRAGDWMSENDEGVLSGVRSLITTWPPQDGAVRLLGERTPIPPGRHPLEDWPEGCEDVERHRDDLKRDNYIRTLDPSVYGGVDFTTRRIDHGEFVVMVTDDPSRHIEALGNSVCVVQIESSLEHRQRVFDAFDFDDLPGVEGAFDGQGRVSLRTEATGRGQIAEFARSKAEPGVFRVTFRLEVLSACKGCSDGPDWDEVPLASPASI